ncbi:MAG TPA: hypothetical protein VIK18_15985 [Pirellulales bacterium]
MAAAFDAFNAANSGCLAWIDYLGLEDLKKGEYPKPLLLRITEHSRRGANQGLARAETILLDTGALAIPEATPQNVLQWRQALGEHVADRSLPFVLRADADVGRVVSSLRQQIPPELVADVLIGQRSWSQF